MSNLKNINLDVANYAMNCVTEVIENTNISSKEYKSLAKKMSTLIQKNGFIGTLVFNLSKINKEHHKQILLNIVKWNVSNSKINNVHNFKAEEIADKIEINNIDNKEVVKEYINWVTSLEPNEYRLLTKEMMNLFGWIKRFADGLIEDTDAKGV